MENTKFPSDCTVVFRYRDLVAKTLEAHDALIKARGSCWWGWWKRPTEEARADIWAYLQEQLQAHSEVLVGLFDSGADDDKSCFRLARVTDIKPPPSSGHQLNWEPPGLTESERELVPEYYRNSQFSRAWLLIREIQGPTELFKRFSYAKPPPLPGIPASELRRLANKVVSDADELRSMDTTIWLIRPSSPDDANDRFLASSVRFSKALESLPLRVAGDSILHLSDLHFAVGAKRDEHVWGYTGEPKRTTLVESVVAALRAREVKVGAIVVSGDLTVRADPEEFRQAFVSLNAMAGALGLGPDHVVVVPGNHDVSFGSGGKKAAPTLATLESETEYRAFYEKLFRHEPDEHLSITRRFIFPCGMSVEICGLNSNCLETSSEYLPGVGRIADGAFERAAESLEWNAGKSSSSFRILALHHHLMLTDDLEPADEYGKGFGMAIDAMKTVRSAAKRGVHIALHGHRHRSFVWRSAVYELPEVSHAKWRLGELSILGAGSCGSRSVKNGNCFNVLKIEPGRVHASIYRSLDGAEFDRLQTWTADLRLDVQDGLRMGDWVRPGEQ